MQKRDIIFTVVFTSLGVLVLIAGLGAAWYFFHKRRKREEDEEDLEQGTCRRIDVTKEKKSRLNGFLSLKTPLISTKALG